jgi:hypothetical protein
LRAISGEAGKIEGRLKKINVNELKTVVSYISFMKNQAKEGEGRLRTKGEQIHAQL